MSALFDRYLVFGKPLWVSEIGVNTTDQAFEATYLKNVYDLARDRFEVEDQTAQQPAVATALLERLKGLARGVAADPLRPR